MRRGRDKTDGPGGWLHHCRGRARASCWDPPCPAAAEEGSGSASYAGHGMLGVVGTGRGGRGLAEVAGDLAVRHPALRYFY